MAYFSTLGDRATDPERLSRAMALRQIGEVRRSQGLLDEASAAFEESLRQVARLQADSPHNDDFLFELGQSEFWVGQTAFERNDLAAAAAALGRYMEHSRALVERDPGNADFQRELSYAHSNLGTLARERRRPSEALAHFERGAVIEQRLLVANADDADLRYSLAESYSWAGTCLLDLGRLDDSEQSFRRALDLLGTLHRHGGNARHSEEYADVGALLAGVLAYRGEVGGAVAQLEQSNAVYAALEQHDPSNVGWERNRLRGERLLAELELAGRDRNNDPAALQRISDEFRRLADADPSNASLQQDLALAERLHALSLWEAGRVEAALVAGRLAHERVSAAARESGRESLRLNAALIADSYGQLLHAKGNPARAADVWSEALRSLDVESAEGPGLVQQALRARLIARLGRQNEAQRLAEVLRRSGYADPRLPLPPDSN
jgi:eukaryotic-like serine/threonine-protein kinase